MNDDIVAILNRLARYRITASKAIASLYRLSVSNKDFKNDALISIRNLFFTHLSNNALNLEKRIELLESLKADYGLTQSLIYIYGAMLKTERFYGSISTDSGEGYYQDYNLRNEEEIKTYFNYALEGLNSALEDDEPLIYELVLERISERLEEQYTYGESETILQVVNEIAKKEKKLPSKLRGKIDHLLVSSIRLSPERKSRLEKFLKVFTIDSVSEELETIVINASYLSEQKVEGGYQDISKKRAQNLAEKYIESKVDWESNLSSLLIGQQRQTFHFAEKIGQMKYTHIELLEKVVESLKKIDISEQSSLFLNGLVLGINDDEFTKMALDKLLNHKNTIGLGVLQTRFLKPISLDDLNKIKPYLVQEPNYLRSLEYLDLSHLTDKEVIELISWLKDINLSFSLEILESIIRKKPERWKALEVHINPLLYEKGILHVSSFINNSLHIEQLIKWSIEKDTNSKKIEFILNEIISCYQDFNFQNDTILNSLVYFLLGNYWDTSWPLLGEYIREKKNIPHGLNYLLLSITFENSKLLNWVKEEPGSREEVAMRFMEIFKKGDTANEKLEFEPEVIELIDNYGMNQKMLDWLESSFTSYTIYSNSAEKLYLKRKELIKTLRNHHIEVVRNFSLRMSAKFDLLIEGEKNFEKNHNLGY